MREYREYYNSILKDEEYKLIEAKERQCQELSFEIQHFHSKKTTVQDKIFGFLS